MKECQNCEDKSSKTLYTKVIFLPAPVPWTIITFKALDKNIVR